MELVYCFNSCNYSCRTSSYGRYLAIAMPTSPTCHLLQLTRVLLHYYTMYMDGQLSFYATEVMNIPTYKHTNTTWLHCTISCLTLRHLAIKQCVLGSKELELFNRLAVFLYYEWWLLLMQSGVGSNENIGWYQILQQWNNQCIHESLIDQLVTQDP